MTNDLFEEQERRGILELLFRWAEREHVKLLGKAMPLPQGSFRWEFNKGLSSFHKIAEGVCWARGTNREQRHDAIDEFGYCFRALPDEDQALILLEHLGEWSTRPGDGLQVFKGESEWKSFCRNYEKRGRYYQKRLEKSWTSLVNAWRKRKREYLLEKISKTF